MGHTMDLELHMKKALGIIGLTSLIGSATLFAKANDSPFTLISAGEQEIVLEVKVPEFKVEGLQHGEVLYQQVTIPDFGLTQEIGKPQVPVRGTLIGLPPTGGITLEILDVSSQVFKGYYLYPVPRSIVDPKSGLIQQEFAIDPEAYAVDGFFPKTIVKEGFSGYMRDQRVAQLLFFPVQFNPIKNEIKAYQRIRVKVRFEGGLTSKIETPFTGIVKTQSPVLSPYERLLKETLLNYQSLPRGE